jgi:uncharacterized membrane protein YedE/YeeE
MVNPARVVGFLDVTGNWDATLAFVMAAAVAITGIAFPLIKRRSRPVFAAQFYLPTKTGIDTPLIAGSIIFGIGWGLAGLCPGPAIAALASLSPSIVMFVIAMIAGQWVVARLQ